ncbi:histidinol-phosphatase HisJ family protein [Nanoarchaeota archaeon]
MVIEMLMDFHIHSNVSSDCKMSIREAYESAVEKGIKNICITNHHEPSEVVKGDFQQSLTDENLATYRATVDELKKDGRVNIFFGIEMCYTEDEEEYIKEFLTKHSFDFVLGSLHYVDGIPVSHTEAREEAKDLDHGELYREYLRLLKKAIQTGLFDVIGHIDIYKKAISEPDFESVRAEWEEVASLLVENDTGFEINTSWSRTVPDGMYPDIKILKVLLEKGVKKITLGSDAHHPEHLGRNFESVIKVLKDLGVKQVHIFNKREPKPLLL